MSTDLTCIRGDTTSWTIVVSLNSAPVDLTGAKLWMTALRSPGGTQIFQLTSPSSGGITPDPDQTTNRGKAVVKLATSSTSGLPSEPVTLVYDIQVLTAAGDIITASYGNLLVTPDVTTATA